MRSILQKEKCCYFCGGTYALHEHHIIYGRGRRLIAERNGFKAWLCPYHHNMSGDGVHFNKKRDLALKQECQRKFEETHTRGRWMKLVGRNYLEVNDEV